MKGNNQAKDNQMALQALGSGPISMGNIRNEFGQTGSVSLGSYRAQDSNYGGTILPTFDYNIPKTGQIKISDFYSKRKGIIIDLYSGGTEYSTNARSRFTNKVGAFVSGGGQLPASSSGSRVYIIINKTLGDSNRLGSCVSGIWETGTDLYVYVNSSGAVFGAGGKGGDSGGGNNPGLAAESGTSAVIMQYPATFVNNGYLQTGFGGGGGGGGVFDNPDKNGNDPVNTGGGGGGGAGLPAGGGGAGGTGAGGGGSNGSAGSPGNIYNGGGGGAGGNTRQAGSSRGGNGGYGGGMSFFFASNGENGQNGNLGAGGGGSAAGNAFALYRVDSSIAINYSGNGALAGNYNFYYVTGINANNFEYPGGTVGQEYLYCGYGYNRYPCPGACGNPFNAYWSPEVFANGGSGKNLSFFILKQPRITSSGNATYERFGYGYRATSFYCTWNYMYTLVIARSGYGYNINDTLSVSWDGRTFVFKPSGIGVA